MIPVRLELTTPPLKVECSKPTELRDLLFVILVTFHNTYFYLFIISRDTRTRTWMMSTSQKWRLSQLVHIPLYVGGRSRCRSQYLSVPPVFKTGSQAVVIHLPYCFPPRVRTSIPWTKTTCPAKLDEGKIYEANMSKNFFFLFEVPIRFELMTPGYKAGILPNYTKKPI